MKLFFLSAFFFLTLSAFAQNDTAYFSTDMDIDIISLDYPGAKAKLENYFTNNQLNIQKQDESKTSISVTLNVNQAAYNQFNTIISELGYVVSRRVNTTNNNLKIKDINLEISYLKNKRKSYIELLDKTDNKTDQYLALWNENKKIEAEIFNKEKELLPYLQKQHNYSISISLSEEHSTPDNSRVSFINMPGFEYSNLFIENPKAGISSKNYQGYFVKYLFTKGKSFAVAGAYKDGNTNKNDSSHFSELFVLGFGQDFYSRHLGSGSRKFLNLYSGYTVGYMLATGANSKSNIYFLSPSVGIELFKNKYILLDTKAVYLIPLVHNKELRGFSINASLNFVF